MIIKKLLHILMFILLLVFSALLWYLVTFHLNGDAAGGVGFVAAVCSICSVGFAFYIATD